MSNDTRVTISDCGQAIEGIEQEIKKQEKEKHKIELNIALLRTQAAVIRQLVRTL